MSNFSPAAALLANAADCIDQASRLVTEQAARAEQLTKWMSSADMRQKAAAEGSMEELTKVAIDIAAKGREIRGYGLWLDGEEA